MPVCFGVSLDGECKGKGILLWMIIMYFIERSGDTAIKRGIFPVKMRLHVMRERKDAENII